MRSTCLPPPFPNQKVKNPNRTLIAHLFVFLVGYPQGSLILPLPPCLLVYRLQVLFFVGLAPGFDQTVLYVQVLVDEVTQGSALGFGVSADFGAALCV